MLEDRIATLRADTRRGSSALADEALAVLAEAAQRAARGRILGELAEVARQLAAARPAMVAVENRVHGVMAALLEAGTHPDDLPGVAASLLQAARGQAQLEREMAARCAAQALRGTRVLTVSWSDTVARALGLAAGGRKLSVVVPQGAPLRDGQRAAERLAMQGLDVELVPDPALGHAALGCDAALADAVLPGGEVVNRAGTSLAALAMAVGGGPSGWCASRPRSRGARRCPSRKGRPRRCGARRGCCRCGCATRSSTRRPRSSCAATAPRPACSNAARSQPSRSSTGAARPGRRRCGAAGAREAPHPTTFSRCS